MNEVFQLVEEGLVSTKLFGGIFRIPPEVYPLSSSYFYSFNKAWFKDYSQRIEEGNLIG